MASNNSCFLTFVTLHNPLPLSVGYPLWPASNRIQRTWLGVISRFPYERLWLHLASRLSLSMPSQLEHFDKVRLRVEEDHVVRHWGQPEANLQQDTQVLNPEFSPGGREFCPELCEWASVKADASLLSQAFRWDYTQADTWISALRETLQHRT